MNRREMLAQVGNGFGLLALGSMLGQSRSVNAMSLPSPHHLAKAKRIIFLFMHGGPSQIDTFDPKPILTLKNGEAFPGKKPRVQFSGTGNLLASPWEFSPGGESGIQVSDLFPEVRKHADKLCVIRSMVADNAAHGGAVMQLHTGSDTLVRPSMGSWVSYGLGSENENLPAFVTLSPTYGHGGVQNWSSSFLPGKHQGTPIGRAGQSIEDAGFNDVVNFTRSKNQQRLQLDFLKELNQNHLKSVGPDPALESRIESYELAYRMQTEAPGVTDISKETAETLNLYGIGAEPTNDFGRQCLLARRFAEAGVRFIQCSHSYKWDQHANLQQDHAKNALEVDKPIAGLLEDLDRRGLLEDTLVWWGGEFGRTPTAQGGNGRDHNPHAFTMWLAGGGVKGGTVHGQSDDFGYYVVKDKVHMHDMHATILHLLGLDHERLTYRHAGRDFRLTDVHGRVVKAILS